MTSIGSAAPQSHPVLDRSPKLRARADAFGLTSPESDWRGWDAPHRFQCEQGHGFDMPASSLLNAFKRCPVCLDEVHLADLHRRAALALVECLEARWLGVDAFYRFRCGHGHEWYDTSRSVTCPSCTKASRNGRQRQPDGLERLQRIAHERGGACSSEQYLGAARAHGFRCAAGHEWETAAAEVMSGAWCPRCASKAKRTPYLDTDGLLRLQQAAAAKGGSCRSAIHAGGENYHAFECAKGHRWQMRGFGVLQGRWCPWCAEAGKGGRRFRADGLDSLRQAAAAQGGECLSDTYLGYACKHLFRCRNSHEWEAAADKVFRGTWCHTCSRADRRHDLGTAQAAAHARGGQCLATEYRGDKVKMEWMCDRGHVWLAGYTQIRRGQWCPTCAHMAKITNPRSKARRKYEPAGHTA